MSDKNSNREPSFQGLDEEIKKLQIEKSVLLQNSFLSQDPESILKAQLYMQNNEKDKAKPKAYFFPFDAEYNTGKDYKSPVQQIPDHILRRVSYVHVINSIINTKINQVTDFLKFTTDDQKEGFTIRKKLSRFQDRNQIKETPKAEQKIIESIVDFLEQGGQNAKWDMHDDIVTFTAKILRDSFTFNRSTFELERNLKNDLLRFVAIDAQTIRYLQTIDPYYRWKNPKSQFAEKKIDGKDYLPRYCQIWNGQIAENPINNEQIVWYPWELAFETRNPSTDIWRNGYGVGEIEVLSQVITWILNGLQYNGNFFSQGSNPKGLLNVKNGDSGGQGVLNSLRQMWRNSVAGVENSHKMPVVEGLDLEWIDMQQSNKDMEFQMWNEFLIMITCSVFTIDPTELGFQFKNQQRSLGQEGQKERLEHSKDKGLKPLLVFLQKTFNKYLVSELDDNFEFVFTGVDLEDETEYIDNDVKKTANGFASLEDMFEKYTHRKFDENKDTILNPIYWQAQQAKQFGGEESNEAVDEMTGEPDEGVENPFDNFDKSNEDNPIWDATKKWMKDNEILK
ncbi:MAG: phage portal protein [Bacteroidales bacterium]|jgi:hypothetical protein|nr:phage portal protein [Bacteroidales bacterium]